MSGNQSELLRRINRDLLDNTENFQVVDSRSDLFPISLQAPPSNDFILHIKLDSWISILSEDDIIRITDNYQYLSIEINGAYASQYSPERITFLSKYISPRLISVSITEASEFTWVDHIKPLLLPAKFIEIFNLPKNPWLDDYAIEQLANKFYKTIRCFIFENCKLSNDTLLKIGKKCSILKCLHLIYCQEISDQGIIAVAPKIRLSHLKIAHNHRITDKGLFELVSNSRQLMSLSVIDCMNLSDDSIVNLFSAKDRMKKNNTSSLTSLVIRDNSNITVEALIALAYGAPELRTLDLRDCPSINITSGIEELEACRHFNHLYLGPSTYPLQSETFTTYMMYHTPNLTVLHLTSLQNLAEQDLSEIIFSSPQLFELALTDIPCGTITIEAIVNSIPDLSILSINGSKLLTDKDIRCLTTICSSMKQLSLQRCSQLTSSAFSRCLLMKSLTQLNISGCSGLNNTSLLINSIAKIPKLSILILDGLNIDFHEAFLLSSQSSLIFTLKSLSLQRCYNLHAKELAIVLNNFIRLESIELTDSSVIPQELVMINNYNPFLGIVHRSNKLGFEIIKSMRSIHDQYFNRIDQIKRYHAARLFITLIKRRRQHLINLKQEQRELWVEFKIQKAILIQSVFRGYLVRKITKKQLKSGRFIVTTMKILLLRYNTRKNVRAKNYYRKKLLLKIFRRFIKYWNRSSHVHRKKSNYIQSKRELTLKRRILQHMLTSREDVNEIRLQNKAIVIWEENICRLIMKHWKRVLRNPPPEIMYRYSSISIKRNPGMGMISNSIEKKKISIPVKSLSSYHRKMRLVKIFLNCVPSSYDNSIQQQHKLQLAISFYHRRLIILSWMCFCHESLRGREIELQLPKARAHYIASFYNRVMRNVFQGMFQYKLYRHNKLRIRRKNELRRALKIESEAMKLYRQYHYKCKRLINLETKAKKFYHRKLLIKTFDDKIRLIVNLIKHRNCSMTKADAFHQRFQLRSSLKRVFLHMTRRYEYYRMNKAALKLRHRIYYRRVWQPWQEYAKTYHDEDEIVMSSLYRSYLLKLSKKIIDALKQNVIDTKYYLTRLGLQTMSSMVLHDNDGTIPSLSRQESENSIKKMYLEKVIGGIVRMQALIRCRIQMKNYQVYRVQCLYSILLIQRQVRRYLGLKYVKNMIRKREIKENIVIIEEQELMKDADLQSQYYEYLIHNIITIQRYFRGFIGRQIKKEFGRSKIRLKSQEEYFNYKRMRQEYECQQLMIITLEHNRNKAAIIIQRFYRGCIARNSYLLQKKNSYLNRKVRIIQRCYRGYLLRKRLPIEAIRRDYALKERFYDARRKRGFLLRLLGFSTRKKQASFAKVLNYIGIDPLTYHYQFSELIKETIDDFFILKRSIEWEVDLFRRFRFNYIAKNRERVVLAKNAGYHFQNGDCVRIIEPGHVYSGYTGIIFRIDKDIPGLPLYEIKLDRFHNKQTYVRMTIDPYRCYESVQPLAHIERNPKLKTLKYRTLYGLRPENPLFKRSNVDAALKIQRCYRSHRARHIAAKKRYEVWLRSAAEHNLVMNNLSDTNTVNFIGNLVMKYFRNRLYKTIVFDEIKHVSLVQKLFYRVNKSDEKKQIHEEYQIKYKQRIMFLQKCAILNAENYLSRGFEKLSTYRCLKLLAFMSYGIIANSGSNLRPILIGSRGIDYLAKRKAMVTGLRRYAFNQFHGSPHVRYPKMSIYQGEWAGIPLFTPLSPHGEGLILFFEAWGIAKENKVLYLTIIRCTSLVAGDLNGFSDPYCIISCNNVTVLSSIKYRTVNPIYNETFEIDVTNPAAFLSIVIKDKDVVGPDDFLGQIRIPLSKYVDGKEHHETIPLKAEDLYDDKQYDNGEIEFKIVWSERKFDEDLTHIEQERQSAIKLQCFFRRVLAIKQLKRLNDERKDFLMMIQKKGIQITNTCRIRLAKKELKRRLRLKRAIIKIQKRIRIFIAKRKYKRLNHRWMTVVMIQKYARVFLSKKKLHRLRHAYQLKKNKCATSIQKCIRRYLIMKKMRSIRQASEDTEEHHYSREPIPITEWLKTYGVDEDFGLRRNRRIVNRAFAKMLRMKYVRFVSKYGFVYLDQFPNPYAPQDIDRLNGYKPEEFAAVYVPSFRSKAYNRQDSIRFINSVGYSAILHISTAINKWKSVEFHVIIIQCAFRIKLAKKRYLKQQRMIRALIKFQRLFRRKNKKLYHAAYRIQCFLRLFSSKKLVRKMRKEKQACILIQCAYRIHLAKMEIVNRRSIEKMVVLKCSSFVDGCGPEKCLEHRYHTFWMTNSNEIGEIRVEFESQECIAAIWIMASTLTASPKYVSISAVLKRDDHKYDTFIDYHPLPCLKGLRWHKFYLSGLISKYFRIVFYENYGDENHISVRQIRFIRSKETSTKIMVEPEDVIIREGPIIGTHEQHKLSIIATGWPIPTFQWYRNNKIIPNAIHSDLVLDFHCKKSRRTRTYRCLNCKMVSREAPLNAYRIQCQNCLTLFTFKELSDYEKSMADITSEELKCINQREKLLTSRLQFEKLLKMNPMNPKYPTYIRSYSDNIEKINSKLRSLKEDRYYLKQRLDIHLNRYSDEGIYHCVVTNIRNGYLKMEQISKKVVVVLENSKFYPLQVYPYYFSRPQFTRKKWTTYSSILGTFNKGKLDGIVTVQYSDGSFYEGPYVGEEWLDYLGRVQPQGRAPNHYGVFHCPDGRVFEGPNVDNHFDVFNIQSFYKLTLPNKETYEGTFCDEQFHGYGLYNYNDKSVYEGQWHRGSQFGHGHYRSSEGWVYEGYFDNNRRHGEGCITWPDGSMYIGQWFYEMIQGKGLFITKLRDVYKGQFVNGLYEGFGVLCYGDGSKYVGEFKNNKRHGRGIFCDKDGTEYYGNYLDDEKDGEFIVKLIVPIEEPGQPNYEIRIGIYDNGSLLRWKSKFSNENTTKTFIRLFKENKEMFDSMFAMILARSLPNLPEGIDPKNKQVQDIIIKIRSEAGSLVGQDALIQAKQKVEDILIPIKSKEMNIQTMKESIETITHQIDSIDIEMSYSNRYFNDLMKQYEKISLQIEQKWLDDPFQTRKKFEYQMKRLKNIPTDEFFKFKNQRIPPIFTKQIMNAICYMLRLSTDWESQKLLLSDSKYNRITAAVENITTLPISQGNRFHMKEGLAKNSVENGTEHGSTSVADKTSLGLRISYDCKLLYLLEKYDVHNYLIDFIDDPNTDEKQTAREKLELILSDPRFRSDSYYIESLGMVGPILVDWIRANYLYIQTARSMSKLLKQLDHLKLEASRFKVICMKKKEEISSLTKQREQTKRMIYKEELDLIDLKESLIRAQHMLKFVEDSFSYSTNDSKNEKIDYYQQLQNTLQGNEIKFQLQTCLESVISQVIKQTEQEKKLLMITSPWMGMKKDDSQDLSELNENNITKWINEEIISQQELLLSKGYDLGYSIDEIIDVDSEDNELPLTPTRNGIKQRVIMRRMKGHSRGMVHHNDQLNDHNSSKIQLTYEIIESNIRLCVEVVITKLNDAYHEPSNTNQWKLLNGRVITSRFLYILTWKYWEEEIIRKQKQIAIQQWESTFQSPSERAAMAIEALVNSNYSKTAKKQAKLWSERNVELIEEMEVKYSKLFEENYPENTGAMALLIYDDINRLKGDMRQRNMMRMIGKPSGPEYPYLGTTIGRTNTVSVVRYSATQRAACLCWIKLNNDIFDSIRDEQSQMMSDMFEKEFPNNTAEEAFKILNGIANNSTDMLWIDYADHWKAFHSDEYETTSNNIIDSMAKEFQISYPNSTYMEAGRILINNDLMKYLNEIFSQVTSLVSQAMFLGSPQGISNPYALPSKSAPSSPSGLSPSLMNNESMEPYEINSYELFNAICYGTRNQGLIKKAKNILFQDYSGFAEKQWKNLVSATENFTIGSFLYATTSSESFGSAGEIKRDYGTERTGNDQAKSSATGAIDEKSSKKIKSFDGMMKLLRPETKKKEPVTSSPTANSSKSSPRAEPGLNPSLVHDPHYQYRKKLELKYAWLYAYYCLRYEQYYHEVNTLDHDNPFRQVHHNLRPSEETRIIRQRESEYLIKKEQLETAWGEVMDRLDAMNTYFGYNAAAMKINEIETEAGEGAEEGNDERRQQMTRTRSDRDDHEGARDNDTRHGNDQTHESDEEAEEETL